MPPPPTEQQQPSGKRAESTAWLMVAYYFPPAHSTAVLRNYQIANQLAAMTRGVTVLTSTNRSVFSQEAMPFHSKVAVTAAPTIDYRRIAFWLTGNQGHYSESVKKSRFIEWFVKLNNTLPFSFLIGEGGLVYIVAAYFQAIRIIRRNQVTHLYSSYRPYSDHLIAWLLKKRFPRLCWVADFRDLQVEVNYRNYFFEPLQHRLNRFFLREASLVTTISEGMAAHLRAYHDRVHVLRNGIPDLQEESSVRSNDRTVIAYTGSLFGDERDPGMLFSTIRDLLDTHIIAPDDVKIVYAGKDSLAWRQKMQEHGIENLLEDRGPVSYREALAIQRESDANLLLTIASPELGGIMTGKFAEYLAARRPMIVLIKGVRDPEFVDLVGAMDAGIVVNDDDAGKQALRNYLIRLIQQHKATGMPPDPIPEAKLDAFRWPRLVAGLLTQISATTHV